MCPALLVCLALAAGCATAPPPPEARGTVPPIWPGSIAGYLTKEEVPDSLALLPPPPAAGSGSLAADEEANRAGRALRGTPRFAQATEDANLTFPRAAGSLACALGAPITEQDTPHLYTLLRRVLSDAGYSTGAAKNKYMRKRPFLVNGEPTCTPADEKDLAKQGSYPSGHSAAGWAWGLVLAEIAPDRAEAVVERGRAFGQSRVVCNVHWQADVNEGRILGAATVARLHGDAGVPRRSRGREEGARRGAREERRARSRLPGRGVRARVRASGACGLRGRPLPRRFPWRSVRRS